MITNFFKIVFPFTHFDVQRIPYSDAGLSAAGQHLAPGEQLEVVTIETVRFQSPAPKFSVEASVANLDVADAYAMLVQPGDGGPVETILPVQKDRRSMRAFLPPGESDSYLIFVMLFRGPGAPAPNQIASLVTLRALD